MLTRPSISAMVAGAVVMIGAAGLGGFAIASALVPVDETSPISPVAYVPDGNGARISVATHDLALGALPWAVRVFRSQTGLACFEAGRVQGQFRDGEFGQVDPDDGKFHPGGLGDAEFGRVDPDTGTFKRLPVEAGISCTDLNDVPSSIAVNHYPAQGHRGARAVVFGVFAPNVKGVRLLVNGEQRDLSFSADGYIGVIGEDESLLAELHFSMDDGTVKRVRLPAVLKPPVQQPPPES
jgi:hypothetical protein